MTWQLPHPHNYRVIELLTLEFADIAYQRKITPAGSARKSAFSTFAASLPPRAVKRASCVEDARKVFVLSYWEPGTHDADRSLRTVVKPLTEHLRGSKWSRQLVVLDSTSVDITSPLWGLFNYELRILNFRFSDERKEPPTEYWKEQEGKISNALEFIRDTLTSFCRIGPMPPAVEGLGYLGLVGGWVVAEDGPALREGLEAGVATTKSRRWAGILGWRDERGERKAWGEEGAGPGQECLHSLGSIANEVGQRWHATRFEALEDCNQRYAFSDSDEDDP